MKRDAGPPSNFEQELAADEKVLWAGQSGFAPASHPAATLTCFAIAGYLVKTTWLAGSVADFCNGGSVSNCSRYYWVLPSVMLLLSFGFAFEWLERCLVKAGRASVKVILTNRRLIRIADWPWRRVRSRSYLEYVPKINILGVLMLGARNGFALSPSDAAIVLNLMLASRRRTQ